MVMWLSHSLISSSSRVTLILVVGLSGSSLDGNSCQNSSVPGLEKSTWSKLVGFLSFTSIGGPNLNGFLHQFSTVSHRSGRPRSLRVTSRPTTHTFFFLVCSRCTYFKSINNRSVLGRWQSINKCSCYLVPILFTELLASKFYWSQFFLLEPVPVSHIFTFF